MFCFQERIRRASFVISNDKTLDKYYNELYAVYDGDAQQYFSIEGYGRISILELAQNELVAQWASEDEDWQGPVKNISGITRVKEPCLKMWALLEGGNARQLIYRLDSGDNESMDPRVEFATDDYVARASAVHIAAIPVAFQRDHVALLAQRAQHIQPSQPCGFTGESAFFVGGEIG